MASRNSAIIWVLKEVSHMKTAMPRFMLAAPASGSGKTTVTCAILQALVMRKMVPAAFKCGRDFIDPLFHSEIIGARGANLDMFFTSENRAKQLMAEAAKTCHPVVIEGVMGYYDGLGGKNDTASAYHVSRATNTPVILILDAKGASLSLCATLLGFLSYGRPNNIRGVVLNRCSKSHYESLTPVLERECGVEVLGHFPNNKEYRLKSRNLGLVTAEEVEDLKTLLVGLAKQAEETISIDRILEIAETAPILSYDVEPVETVTDKEPCIAIARDRAFCFYYRENLELLKRMGAKLCFFSPLNDASLPEETMPFIWGAVIRNFTPGNFMATAQ
jgi:cobyrinic acid a,c-diamide synthase